jgi:hypothetical protein
MRQGRFHAERNGARGLRFIGVSKTARGYEARCHSTMDGEHAYLGKFRTAEEAALAYDRRALELRGPMAVTNFDWTDAQRGMTFASTPVEDPVSIAGNWASESEELLEWALEVGAPLDPCATVLSGFE